MGRFNIVLKNTYYRELYDVFWNFSPIREILGNICTKNLIMYAVVHLVRA